MNIEPLESRIAPAAVLHYIDIDGDAVTITISKGTTGQLSHVTQTTPESYFTKLDLLGDHAFDGADITVTAKPQLNGGVLRGDGHTDVGFIDATGLLLGKVTIPGDLGKLVAGPNTTTVSVKSLVVDSLGARGTGGLVPDLQTLITGQLGTAKIKGDLKGYLNASEGIGSVSVGGDIVGGSVDKTGSIYTPKNLGPVTVKGNVIGGTGLSTGAIGAGQKLGNVTIGGSLLGGFGDDSGKIYSGLLMTPVPGANDMGAIKIGRDVIGGKNDTPGNGENSGLIDSKGAIVSVTIGGSLRGNLGEYSGLIHAVGDIGAVQIGGSMLGESGGTYAGSISAQNIKSVKVGGSIVGGDANNSGSIFALSVPTLSIAGDVAGGAGQVSGVIDVNVLGTVTIGGTIRGAIDPDLSDAVLVGQNSGVIDATSITKLTIGGSLEGTNAVKTGYITLTGDLGSLTIGGDVRGGTAEGLASGAISVNGKIGTAVIRGSLVGAFGGDGGGSIAGKKGITKITVGGSVVGGNFAYNSGLITAEEGTLGSVFIGGDLVGGERTNFGGGGGIAITDSGSILAKRIGNVTIGGSIFSGSGIFPSGAIISDEDIGAIVVKGSLVGRADNPVKIFARGLAGDPIEKNIAIKSLTVGGRVEEAEIFAGVDKNRGAVTGHAQIGPVKVGGAWIASLLVTGAVPESPGGSGGTFTFGDATDAAADANGKAKIASVVIGGPVLGRADTGVTFGFIAREIGSFKYQGIAVALTKGAANDTFALGKAQPVGPSRTGTAGVPDGFAVHVFEV